MNQSQNYPDEYLTQRLTDRLEVDPELRGWLDTCLREWGGVALEDATVGDMLRASRAAAAIIVERSPRAAAVMAGREGFTATELLREMGKANRS
ncbi:hypothetical protein G6027_06330 [Dietzia sp. SLG310A2-38A2]|uniref:hypothetical protein n=1 Tax=Dietzia sp. SLG310A2-38A2 TaxID=1630643 RepID=UPI0015FA80C5|nr:hypothetical protein [Dietzia sp. SLG310A2-38A2]MBB1030504.1 hypothetical protein [Dietzia sp. SLG310A2-38A2]